MATKQVALRAVLEYLNDLGANPADTLDTDTDGKPLVLSGDIAMGAARFRIPTGTTDTVYGPAGAQNLLGYVIFSLDQPIALRLAAGQQQLVNIRFFSFFGHDADPVPDSVGLPVLSNTSGNTANVIVAWITKDVA